MLCSGKLLAGASAASLSATPPKTIMSALGRRCALIGGLICFFIVVHSVGISETIGCVYGARTSHIEVAFT